MYRYLSNFAIDPFLIATLVAPEIRDYLALVPRVSSVRSYIIDEIKNRLVDRERARNLIHFHDAFQTTSSFNKQKLRIESRTLLMYQQHSIYFACENSEKKNNV